MLSDMVEKERLERRVGLREFMDNEEDIDDTEHTDVSD